MKPYFFIRSEKKFIKINQSEIIYVESLGNDSTITTTNGSFLTLVSLRQFELEILSKESFRRINKSCLVNLDHVISFDRECVYLKGKRIALGEKYRVALQQSIVIVMSNVREPLKMIMREQ